jgi:putative DNA primase/helicase
MATPNVAPSDGDTAPNSIRPTKRPSARRSAPEQREAEGTAASPPKAKSPRAASSAVPGVPDEVQKRFVQVGRTYYFPDGARAFTDRVKRLTTPSENTEVIRSLISIAQARGWSDITVSGTERFRKEAWHAAKVAGLEVRGYVANDIERAQLVRRIARERERQDGTTANTLIPAERGIAEPTPGAPRERRGGLIVGRLTDHGRATYQHDSSASMSYFVKLETARGERTIWGVDLERAFRESLTKPQPGDEIGLRAVRQDPVTVKAPQRDADGRVLGAKDLATHRNRWIVEKRAFFEERRAAARIVRDPSIEPKRAVDTHPALVGTYLNLHAAELAAKRFPNSQDRERFVGLVRHALADAIARGEPLPAARLRQSPTERPKAQEPATQSKRATRVPERDRTPARE